MGESEGLTREKQFKAYVDLADGVVVWKWDFVLKKQVSPKLSDLVVEEMRTDRLRTASNFTTSRSGKNWQRNCYSQN
ncbi:MAG: hypothetical protein MUO63_11825 [Desulfobulbaceae bacterium]|nr:hypothetical protein [Desulfobulbaceae bacterium]